MDGILYILILFLILVFLCCIIYKISFHDWNKSIQYNVSEKNLTSEEFSLQPLIQDSLHSISAITSIDEDSKPQPNTVQNFNLLDCSSCKSIIKKEIDVPEGKELVIKPHELFRSFDSSSSSVAVRELKTPRIFLVDDSVVVRTKLSRVVSSEGYDVCLFNDGADLISKIELDIPDLIITDIEMPDVNGFEVIEFLLSNKATKSIPVIAISGHDGISDHLKNYPNIVMSIGKPWSNDEVLRKIKDIVGC